MENRKMIYFVIHNRKLLEFDRPNLALNYCSKIETWEVFSFYSVPVEELEEKSVIVPEDNEIQFPPEGKIMEITHIQIQEASTIGIPAGGENANV